MSRELHQQAGRWEGRAWQHCNWNDNSLKRVWIGIEKIIEISNEMYDSREFPEDLCQSVFIALPKKPGAVECNRTISLMSHVVKIILRIIMARSRSRMRPEMGRELALQFCRWYRYQKCFFHGENADRKGVEKTKQKQKHVLNSETIPNLPTK